MCAGEGQRVRTCACPIQMQSQYLMALVVKMLAETESVYQQLK